MRDHLANALKIGQKVTAKVKWLSKAGQGDRYCWIHCTPLLGANDTIGVWVVILVHAEKDNGEDNQPDKLRRKSIDMLSSEYIAAATPWVTDWHPAKATSNFSESTGERGSVDDRVPGKSNSNRGRENLQSEEYTASKLPSSAAHPKAGRHILEQSGHLVSDHPTVSGDDYASRGEVGRPMSRDSSVLPMRAQLQPKINIIGRTSIDGENSKMSPIKLPGHRMSEVEVGSERPPVKKTYKSLSPYGVLFED